MPTLTIDNAKIEVPEGTSVLEACRQAGAYVPTLCYLEGVQAIGACRICLVEIEGARALAASCTQPVAEGMVVKTNSARARRARRAVLELLLSEHDGDCYTASAAPTRVAQAIGRDGHRPAPRADPKLIDLDPGLVRDTGCIMCRRCVTVCNEVQGVGAPFRRTRFHHPHRSGVRATLVTWPACSATSAPSALCAITEKSPIELAALEDPEKHVIVQTARHPRSARRGIRLRAGDVGHRQDGFGPPPSRL